MTDSMVIFRESRHFTYAADSLFQLARGERFLRACGNGGNPRVLRGFPRFPQAPHPEGPVPISSPLF